MVQTAAFHDRASQRASGKKRQILEAASRVFRRRGLQAAGMREIAAEAGMRAGNLYYYFESRQELLAFCQEETLRGLLDLAERVRSGGLAPDRQLYLLIVGHVVMLNEAIPGSLAHLEIEAVEDPWRARIVERRDRYERVYRGVIAEGVACGVFADCDSKTATMAILGATNWTVKWFRPGGRQSAGDIGRAFADTFVRGLLAPQAALTVQAGEIDAIESAAIELAG